MKHIFEIDKTDINPYVYMNAETGEFNFEGRSLVEYPSQFYDGVMDWINTNKDSFSSDKINLTISMDYVNTASSGVFAKILKQIVSLKEDLEITWRYETDDIDCLELGEDYSRMLKKKFVFIEY